MLMKNKQTIINRMLDILAEANDLDSDIIDHHTFYEAYHRAADMLNFEEWEDGENDIYKFTIQRKKCVISIAKAFLLLYNILMLRLYCNFLTQTTALQRYLTVRMEK